MTAVKTLRIRIVNPKAERLIDDLASLDLIEIDEPESPRKSIKMRLEDLSRNIEKHQADHGNPEPPSMEDIVAEVKKVRRERYAKANQSK